VWGEAVTGAGNFSSSGRDGDKAGLLAYADPDEQTLFRRWLEVPARKGGKIQMGLIPGFYEVKESVEEAINLLRRAVAALEKLAAEQERANDLYAEVNQVSLAQAQNVTELSR
jgi:hypothetical protein